MANEFPHPSPKDTSDAVPSQRAVPPVPPVDDRIELVVSIPIAPKSGDVQGRRQVVRAGAVLARRIRGTPGTSGADVLCRVLPVRSPREARLPQGPHTLNEEGGTQLLAACDGEVRMRNLLVEVHPMTIHEGDVPAGTFAIHPAASLFITGSVGESACVEAGGDICIQGHVREASVVSRGGNILVMGSVIGTAQQPATLEATGDITCGPMRHGRASANRDVHMLAEAWQSVLHMGGHLVLDQQVEQSLRDVL
ncbi:MAG: FapA family protein, partial [Chloroflexota bacterium]